MLVGDVHSSGAVAIAMASLAALLLGWRLLVLLTALMPFAWTAPAGRVNSAYCDVSGPEQLIWAALMVVHVSSSRSHQLSELWLCGCGQAIRVTINYYKLRILLCHYSNEAINYPNEYQPIFYNVYDKLRILLRCYSNEAINYPNEYQAISYNVYSLLPHCCNNAIIYVTYNS